MRATHNHWEFFKKRLHVDLKKCFYLRKILELQMFRNQCLTKIQHWLRRTKAWKWARKLCQCSQTQLWVDLSVAVDRLKKNCGNDSQTKYNHIQLWLDKWEKYMRPSMLKPMSMNLRWEILWYSSQKGWSEPKPELPRVPFFQRRPLVVPQS